MGCQRSWSYTAAQHVLFNALVKKQQKFMQCNGCCSAGRQSFVLKEHSRENSSKEQIQILAPIPIWFSGFWKSEQECSCILSVRLAETSHTIFASLNHLVWQACFCAPLRLPNLVSTTNDLKFYKKVSPAKSFRTEKFRITFECIWITIFQGPVWPASFLPSLLGIYLEGGWALVPFKITTLSERQ